MCKIWPNSLHVSYTVDVYYYYPYSTLAEKSYEHSVGYMGFNINASKRVVIANCLMHDDFIVSFRIALGNVCEKMFND